MGCGAVGVVYPTQERVVELQQIKFRQTMKVACVYFRLSVVQSARYRKHSCGLKFLSLVLGMSHLQNHFRDSRSGDLFCREFSHKSVSVRKSNAQGIEL